MFLLKKGWIRYKLALAQFVTGFRKAAPFIDIVDAGSTQDAVDDKLLGQLMGAILTPFSLLIIGRTLPDS